MKVVNPATNYVIAEVKPTSKMELKESFLKLKKGQKTWAKIPLSERLSIIKKFTELLGNNLEGLAQTLTSEVGKPITEARSEIKGAIQKTQFFLNESEKILKTEKVNQDGNTEEILAYDPLGVIANISAWNYPYLVGVNIFIPALICGNAVMYKPSEYSTLVGQSIAKYLHQAGVPEDVFALIQGEGNVGAMLCELDLDGYFFTGSYGTGKKIAQAVADKLVPVGLELGGKDPLYITDEISDLKTAAENAAWGVFYNNGQSCCSVERIYVHENVYDEFVENFVSFTRTLKVDDPTLETTQLGAITRPAQMAHIKNQVHDALAKGAKLLTGGKELVSEASFFEPTVFIDVNHDMELMIEETFGPLIGIQKVSSDEEAVALMNDTYYGLTSAVFCENRERGEQILKEINSGTGYLNCCDRVSGYLPWSGRGRSGLGSTLSRHGLYAFCAPKGLHIRS